MTRHATSGPAAGTTGASPPSDGPVGDRPAVQVWVERSDGWHPAPAASGTGGAAGAADVRTTWVVTADLDGLVATTRDLATDARTSPLLDHHVRHGGHGDRPHARLDRGPDGQVVLTAPTLSFVPRTREVHTGWITCVLSRGLVVTTEEGDAGVLAAAAARLEDDMPDPDEGAYAVAAAVLLVLVQTAGDVEVEIGDAVACVEREVFSPHAVGDVMGEVYALKREIAEGRRALGPVGAVLPDLDDTWAEHGHGHGSPAWLRRVRSGVERIDRHLDGHDSLLGDMVAVHLAQVSVRQNEDMRKISAWAAMIAVPTLVAGVYGMNFRHMPELDWTFGYPLAITAMVVACVALWRAFRRSGWL
ncbi:CorA family divalent cation transporter [Cellulomonas sp. S1-8]|uniref:CorA family divalent cation transporter n=1 Tax=Cellulomonas sp. S1-8 TaxID=2904790 RepID=UPI00224436E9|nr:CorA family divalent cation transporter [Cellulomonas sp. S1-8]UZN01602.1 magnesium and cobalt transport protein CorA [Cellulomonas sp. S1-8]